MNHYDSQQNHETRADHYHTIRLRRRSTSEWLALVIWLVSLAILLDYALSSFGEQENQAGVLAGAIFIGLLGAGIITQIVRGVEAHRQQRRSLAHQMSKHDRDSRPEGE